MSTDVKQREAGLARLLDAARSVDGSYDCIVSGISHRASCYAAWKLKFAYGMHPLTVTWAPCLFTDSGLRDFRCLSNLFDNYLFSPNGIVHRQLTKAAFERFLQPQQPSLLAKANLAPRISSMYKIPLMFYCAADSRSSYPAVTEYAIGDKAMNDLAGDLGLTGADIGIYVPTCSGGARTADMRVRNLGDYIDWTAQDCRDLVVEKCGFSAEHEHAEDKLEDLFDFAGRIRSGNARVNRDDLPRVHFREILEYLDMDEERFWQVIESRPTART